MPRGTDQITITIARDHRKALWTLYGLATARVGRRTTLGAVLAAACAVAERHVDELCAELERPRE